jgi:acyl transferase domain-containing protein
LTDRELLDAGADPRAIADPNYVKAASVLDGIDLFDAPFFGFSPKDAAIMDPQHRVFLECAWEALEHAGWTADEFPGSIGVFAGSGMNSYLMFHLVPNQQLMSGTGLFLIKQTGNDKDVLATRVSYQMNLTGPSMTIQTACSTSLVAVHTACQSLLHHECDMALAGGVTIEIPHKQGYLYREGEILSRDGHCRSFSAEATGTIFGSGAGVVVLRRLEDALADGDHIHAVIRGSAVNNDGARKVGYLAPSVSGQAEVVAEALAVADVDAESISYIEAHGTATPVGDPIEIAALTQAFRKSTAKRAFCAIGSLKSNIGHLDAAAGVAGLIKTVLSLEHEQLPPSLHFEKPNPRIDFANSPFYVNQRVSDWPKGPAPRRAGVTSLGIGGTNAHVILQEAPAVASSGASRPWQVLTLSAKTPAALDAAASRLAVHLEQHPGLPLADVAFTLHRGRKSFPQRRALVCRTREEAIAILRHSGTRQDGPGHDFRGQPAALSGVAFLFPGQGAQYAGMARGIYENEPLFRTHVDQCAELLRADLGLDLRALLFPPDDVDLTAANAALTETRIAQPAIFVIEYALAKLWMSWGVAPVALIGHSVGEFVAACISGVLSVEDALHAVAARGRLMQSADPGAMLAVQMPEGEARSLAAGAISLAAVNGPQQAVLSGPFAAIDALEKKLTAARVPCQRLQTSHAFHSSSMDAVLDAFTDVMRGCRLHPPAIPYLSNVTGAWIMPAEATDPAYWVRHLRQTVRFSDGLAALYGKSPAVLLEVGPGRVLAGLAARHPAKTETTKIVTSLRSAQEPVQDLPFLLSAVAQLWIAGTRIEWSGFHAGERRRRVVLPAYPFERQRYWIDAPKPAASPAKRPALAYYRPVWKRADLPAAGSERAAWLVFADSLGIGAAIAKDLESDGHTVVTVAAGERFAKTGKRAYTVAPAQRADYHRLLDALIAAGHVPQRILHLWSLAPSDAPQGIDALPAATALSFYSLLYLAQAIGAHDLVSPMSLGIVSNGLQSVAGEAIHHPARAVLLGPCRIIPKEFTSVRSRSIDIALHATPGEQILRQIRAEMDSPFTQPSELVAYRGDERWLETLEPATLGSEAPRLRPQGVYMITGGTGGIGLVIAESLARSVRAKLVLVSRSGAAPAARIHALQQLGAEVLIARADVTDLAAMQRVVAQARQRFGTIHGVIHAAGVIGDGLIQLKQKDAADRVLAPKVLGTLVLETALAGADLDFLALFSSVSCFLAPVGQVDYVAANAFLDAFANARGASGKPWTVAINWGRWGETGMGTVPAAFAKPAAGASSRHPLLGVCTTNTPDALVYGTELRFDDHWILNEHCLRAGDALFPGTGYIELARAAASARFASGAIEFEHLTFNAPLWVARGKSRSIELRLKRAGDGYTLSAGISVPPTICATGSLRPLTAVALAAIDLAALLAACRERELSFGPGAQNSKQARHIDFGPRWRCLRRIHFGIGQAVSELELPAEYAPELAAYGLHPALLDAATGSALFTIPDYHLTGDLYVPVSYGRLRVYADLPRHCWCHIRWPQGNTVEKEPARFDITIVDERGAVIAEIEEFTLRRLPGAEVLAVEASSAAVTISSAQGDAAFAAILEGPRVARILAVPHGLRFDAPPPPVDLSLPSSSRPAPAGATPRDSVEQTLAQWWQELLGIGEVSMQQDFFELGGHSLIAVRLFAKIKNHFGVELDLATLFEARTIEALAIAIRAADDRKPAALAAGPARGAAPALFLIPGIDGADDLASCFAPGRPVFELPPDREAGLRLEDLAAHCIREMRTRQPEGPYSLFGFSLGGSVALEMARQLHAAGERVGFLGLLETRRPAHTEPKVTVPSARWKQVLRDKLPWLSGPAKRPPSEAAPDDAPRHYPGRITLFRAGHGEPLPRDTEWDLLAADDVDVHEIPGLSDQILIHPAIDALVSEIEDCLERLAAVPDAAPVSHDR